VVCGGEEGVDNMALKDLLSSLFKKKQEEAELPEDAAENQEESSAEEEEPEASIPELVFPQGHPFQKLWTEYAGGVDFAPPLRMELLPDAPALSPNELPREKSRLEQLINGTAYQRLTAQMSTPPRVLDAEVQVFVTTDRMLAWLLIYPPFNGGENVNVNMIQTALEHFRVRYGVNEEILEQIPDLPERYFSLIPIAFGEPPVHGKDGYVIDLFSRSPVRTLKEDEEGRIDYSAVETFQNVKKGEVVCRIIPPTPCVNGRSVADTAVPAKQGKPATVPKGRNTEMSEEGDALIASRDGHVEFSGRSFQVKPVLDIGGNVDFSTGNIKCLGDVHIHGDVTSGFTVRATGNVTVDGVVEACTIEAGGDLLVRKGVQGNKQAVVRAHRSIFAKYLESCNVYARENLEAECIISCDVYSDGAVTIRSGRGAIIGGQVRAAQMVSANIVGARSGCRTSISLGGRPCEEFERETLQRELKEMEAELPKVERQPDSPAKLRQLSKLRVMISANKMKLKQFDKELKQREQVQMLKDRIRKSSGAASKTEKEPAELPPEGAAEDTSTEQMDAMAQELEKQAEQKQPSPPPPCSGRLLCNTLFPGTEITIGASFLRVEQEAKMCTVKLKGDQISLY